MSNAWCWKCDRDSPSTFVDPEVPFSHDEEVVVYFPICLLFSLRILIVFAIDLECSQFSALVVAQIIFTFLYTSGISRENFVSIH